MSGAFTANCAPIASAPKDGRIILVAHDEVGVFAMAWNPTATNHLFCPGGIGMWEAPDKSMTWREGDDGPSHWKPWETGL